MVQHLYAKGKGQNLKGDHASCLGKAGDIGHACMSRFRDVKVYLDLGKLHQQQMSQSVHVRNLNAVIPLCLLELLVSMMRVVLT